MKKKIAVVLTLLMSMALLAGCGQSNEPSEEEEPPEEVYPISINGIEVRVGETTVQTLLDGGYKVTVSEMDSNNHITEYEIDPEEQLEAMSYYSGASVWITDSTFAHISMATTIPAKMGDAVIARLEFYMGGEPEEWGIVSLNGVPVNEINQDKGHEMFPDFSIYDYYMVKYGKDYNYSFNFSQQNDLLNHFSVEKEYDVDWNGDGQ
ncbi:MAG: hypothetical protein HFH87_05935 [Lachnospiraceae bacterium]|nr:hypothetical protein [Lachnospiraceae bacterium]